MDRAYHVDQTCVMPEGPEAEISAAAARRLIGCRIESLWVDERCSGSDLLALVGARIRGVGRTGKWVLVDTEAGSLGLHFGMTGRLVIDGVAAIDRLEYGSARDESTWDRLRITVSGDVTRTSRCGSPGEVRVNDPRRWSRFETAEVLDGVLCGLGVDVFALTPARLAEALRGRRTLKAVLLDQGRIAGLGNLCVDEVLFQVGIAPTVTADSVGADRIEMLGMAIPIHLGRLLERGGSHRGELSPALRRGGARCPRDGAQLRREIVAGRSTVWCPLHQEER